MAEEQKQPTAQEISAAAQAIQPTAQAMESQVPSQITTNQWKSFIRIYTKMLSNIKSGDIKDFLAKKRPDKKEVNMFFKAITSFYETIIELINEEEEEEEYEKRIEELMKVLDD